MRVGGRRTKALFLSARGKLKVRFIISDLRGKLPGGGSIPRKEMKNALRDTRGRLMKTDQEGSGKQKPAIGGGRWRQIRG